MSTTWGGVLLGSLSALAQPEYVFDFSTWLQNRGLSPIYSAYSYQKIANHFGVHFTTVGRIVRAAANASQLDLAPACFCANQTSNSRIFDLNNPADRLQIAREAEMGYLNLTEQNTRIYVQTGMDNTPGNAAQSAQALSALLKQPTGYLNNATDGLSGDVGEYLPNSITKKDVINEYTYRTLNDKGATLIITHSAGNEDARKALQAGALYGHEYSNLSFVSVGSPVGANALQVATNQGSAQFLGQVNDWRDPVTYSKTAGTVSLGGFLTGLGYGAVQGCGAGVGGGYLGCIAGGITGAAVGAAVGAAPGVATFIGLKNYHPFDQYIAKPQVQSIMYDWLKANPSK